MIVAVPSHLGIMVIIDALSLIFIAFGTRRILIGRRYEDDVDKRVISLFLLGMFFLAIAIVADMLTLMGMSSYLINNEAAILLKTLVPVCFLFGAYHLHKNK